MNKEFIPYEQALELNELGFDDECFGVYYNPTQELFIGKTINPFTKEIRTFAPLYHQAFRWFREKYELSSWIYNSHLDKYFYTILMNGRFIKVNEQSTTHEEAELECLKKLIELVKNK
ncbi:MAG: hypothetical protein EBR55_05510 [Chitinophagia bacterium]|nr:hypothetical protein [Chitinophagia bacterium]